MRDDEVAGLDRLLSLPDNELLDLLLGRTEPEDELADEPCMRVLRMLREA